MGAFVDESQIAHWNVSFPLSSSFVTRLRDSSLSDVPVKSPSESPPRVDANDGQVSSNAIQDLCVNLHVEVFFRRLLPRCRRELLPAPLEEVGLARESVPAAEVRKGVDTAVAAAGFELQSGRPPEPDFDKNGASKKVRTLPNERSGDAGSGPDAREKNSQQRTHWEFRSQGKSGARTIFNLGFSSATDSILASGETLSLISP